MGLSLTKLFTKSPTLTLEVSQRLPPKHSEGAFFRYLFPGDDEQLSVPQRLVMDVVKQDMAKKETREQAVPRLPIVIPKLLKSLRDPESSARHYVDIIKKDPAMCAAVLKLANSVYFNPIGKRIDDIEPAVVKLGIDGLRSVLSAAVFQPIIRKSSPYFSECGYKLWLHSLHCAVACELIGAERGQERFKVYLLGLVHDIGYTTIFSELSKQYALNSNDRAPRYTAFGPLMRVLGPATSLWVAKDWGLPGEVCLALAEKMQLSATQKHQGKSALSTNAQAKPVSEFGSTLYQANLVAEMHVTLRRQNPGAAADVLSELNLPSDIFDRLDQVTQDL